MNLDVHDKDRYYTINLKVLKTTRDVRGIVLLMAALEKANLRPEAKFVLAKLKESWKKNFPPPEDLRS